MKIFQHSKAFSLVEALITVGVVGTLAAIATLVTSNVVGSAREQRLVSDVATLNRAVSSFIASGGDLSGASDPAAVLAALKTEASQASRQPGFAGTKIDDRLGATLQSPGEAARVGLRAYWDPSAMKFVVANRGNGPGIKSFHLDETSGPTNRGVRQTNAPLLYAQESGWIWDYTEATAPPPPGPSEFVLGTAEDSTPPAAPMGTPSGSKSPLLPPTFSLPGGDFPIASFDLSVSLHDPNPAGISELYYSIDFGNWLPYSGPLSVPPGSVVAAQTISISKLHTHSPKVDHSYVAIPAELIAPVISTSGEEFGLFVGRTLTVTILDLNSPGISMLEYRIGGDPWQPYTGPFDLSRDDYPSGALIVARAVPTDPHYLPSTTSLQSLGVEQPVIGGSSAGSFSDPVGQTNLITNLAPGESSSFFAWGRDYWTEEELRRSSNRSELSQSWLSFDGLSFSEVTEGERFQIGRLTYFNGTNVAGTGATGITFQSNLALSMNGVATDASFSFDFELINVLNKMDPNDPWADADFVRLADPVASQIVSFQGLEYQFILEFGQSTEAGIALFDEFHVLEWHSATTNVYGTLVPVGTEIRFNR